MLEHISMSTDYIKSRHQGQPTNNVFVEDKIDPSIAGPALIKGIMYVQRRLGWNNQKMANILGLPSSTLNDWLSKGKVPLRSNIKSLPYALEPIIHLLAIHRNLESMFTDSARQKAWLSTFHPKLNGIPEVLMGESFRELINVRCYLDYVRSRGA